MSKFSKVIILSFALAACACGACMLCGAQSTAQTSNDPRTTCAADIQRLCAGVPAGGGRILACLKQHKDEVSDSCKNAILGAMQRSAGGSGSTSAVTPQPAEHHDANPAPAVPSSAATQPATTASTSKGPGPADHSFLMKQVKIIDQGMGQGKPVYDLMVPTSWQFKGWVNVGVAEGGCYSDWFSVFGDGKTDDNSIEFQMIPKYTWQYTDDPAGQRQMQLQNQKDAQVGMKPCPVRAPIKASEFLRQDILPKFKNATVVSIDDFPELNQITRQRLGLPPDPGTGGVRTDAARARIAYEKDGQPVEAWLTAAVVVRPIPTGGRGMSYDCHAVNVMFFRAPKGKLDANDRLFKLIMSTIRPEPQWQQWSNGVIASLYRKKQEELAKQSAIIAQFQMHVAETINGVVANQQAGANQAAFGQDQIIRGVQTFRDPSTGSTFELSNQYDHAWLNGANEYVMSDDPNFTPNGNLNGNWTQLQVVHPQP